MRTADRVPNIHCTRSGVKQTQSGRWEASAYGGGRCVSSRTSSRLPSTATTGNTHTHKSCTTLLHTYTFLTITRTLWDLDRNMYLGTYDNEENAARLSDFAVLSLCGVDTPTAINFDKGSYLGADGTLLPVEDALPGLGRDQHKKVRDKLPAAVAGAGGAADDGGEGGSESDSGSAGPASPARPGTATVCAGPSARRPGQASADGAPDGHGQAPGAPVPQLPQRQAQQAQQQAQQQEQQAQQAAGAAADRHSNRQVQQQQAQQQLPPAPPAKYRGGCMCVQAAQRAAVLRCRHAHAHAYCRECARLGVHTTNSVACYAVRAQV
jgi:hypothetical protein